MNNDSVELVPAGDGTVLRMETGFREMGWEAAVLEQHNNEHWEGWETFLARLGRYAEELVSSQ